MNRLLYGICVMFVLVGIGGALTVRGQASARAINNDKGVAVQGYDVVAYFTDKAAVKGSARFVHTWNGVEWRFASPEHRDAFEKDPARYAPAFGGYCAYGVSRGYAVDIDPEAFAVVTARFISTIPGVSNAPGPRTGPATSTKPASGGPAY